MTMTESPGTRPVDQNLFTEFERAMIEEVIPEIVEVMTLRARMANESRNKFIDR